MHSIPLWIIIIKMAMIYTLFSWIWRESDQKHMNIGHFFEHGMNQSWTISEDYKILMVTIQIARFLENYYSKIFLVLGFCLVETANVNNQNFWQFFKNFWRKFQNRKFDLIFEVSLPTLLFLSLWQWNTWSNLFI